MRHPTRGLNPKQHSLQVMKRKSSSIWGSGVMNGEGDGLTDQGLVCSIINVVLVCHGEEAAEPKIKGWFTGLSCSSSHLWWRGVTKRTRSQTAATKISFILRVAGHSLKGATGEEPCRPGGAEIKFFKPKQVC